MIGSGEIASAMIIHCQLRLACPRYIVAAGISIRPLASILSMIMLVARLAVVLRDLAVVTAGYDFSSIDLPLTSQSSAI